MAVVVAMVMAVIVLALEKASGNTLSRCKSIKNLTYKFSRISYRLFMYLTDSYHDCSHAVEPDSDLGPWDSSALVADVGEQS